MNPTLKTFLNVVLDLYQAGKREMQRRKIPLWVAPLLLALIVGGCTVQANSLERRTYQVCTKRFKQEFGFFARPTFTSFLKTRTGVAQVEGRYKDNFFYCTYGGTYGTLDFGVQ